MSDTAVEAGTSDDPSDLDDVFAAGPSADELDRASPANEEKFRRSSSSPMLIPGAKKLQVSETDGTQTSSSLPTRLNEDVPRVTTPNRRSWGDYELDDDVELRSPGEGVRLHQRLSSPSRSKKLTGTAARLKADEKQARASAKRRQLQEQQSERLRSQSQKVDVVRAKQHSEGLMLQNKLNAKLDRARRHRQKVLAQVRRKAQEEELKVNEISFIKSMEEANRKVEAQEKERDDAVRLNRMEALRRLKFARTNAKGHAAQSRRQQLEAERQAKIQEKELARQVVSTTLSFS